MSKNDFRYNVRFSAFFPFLPYGLCSKYATNISHQDNPYARMLLLGKNPDATVKAAESFRKNMLDRTRYMCDMGFATEQIRACGSPATDHIFRYLTQKSLATLTDFPISVLRQMSLCDFPSTVLDGQFSPLASGIGQAESIHISTSGISKNQLYAIWRQSHMQAMFLANRHLTCLDRKPYGSGIILGPIQDEASYQRYIRQRGNTLLAYSYRTLSDLYANNPDLYTITQQHLDDSNKAYDEWLRTPALYLRNELPDVPPGNSNGQNTRLYGSKQAMYRTDIGIAVGRRVNYACYHTHPSTFRWNKKREQATKTELARAIRFMHDQSPHLPYKQSVDFALLFCPTRHQFFNIFKSTIERHKAGKSTPCPVDGPYTSTHIIPINDTGTYMLRRFLEDSPESLRMSCTNYLLESDDRFGDSVNYFYPLTYNGKRVFAGYAMDIKRIHKALVDHLNGLDFYILCYPEQLPWYRMLFPNKTFL